MKTFQERFLRLIPHDLYSLAVNMCIYNEFVNGCMSKTCVSYENLSEGYVSLIDIKFLGFQQICRLLTREEGGIRGCQMDILLLAQAEPTRRHSSGLEKGTG